MNRPISLLAPIALIGLLFGSGCTVSGVNLATAAARFATVQAQATHMALRLHTASAADAAQATATAQAWQETLQVAAKWPLVTSDPFDDNSHEWPIGSKSGEYADTAWVIEQGTFRWTATAKQGFVWWNTPTLEDLANLYVAVDIRQISGPDDAYLGIIFRHANDDDYYAFTVSPRTGAFSLDRHSSSGWVSLIPWTDSPAIELEDVNRIAVIARQNRIALFANGQLLTWFEDAAISAGNTGLIIGMNNEGDRGAFEFDNFEVRTPLRLTKTVTPAR